MCSSSQCLSARNKLSEFVAGPDMTGPSSTVCPGGHSEWEPPDPFSNSEVKTLCADASVDFVDVKVGHCQALNLMENENPRWRKLAGVFLRLSRLHMKTLLALRKRLPLCQHRSNDQFAQHFLVHIRKRLDVKTALAGGVFAQLGEQQLGLVAVHDTVQNRRRFSRRETHQNRVTLAPALILIMVGTEANDRRPPHSGCFARGAFHQSNERFRVGPLGRLRQCVDERRYTHRGRLGFIGRHRLPPPILKTWRQQL